MIRHFIFLFPEETTFYLIALTQPDNESLKGLIPAVYRSAKAYKSGKTNVKLEIILKSYLTIFPLIIIL